MEITCKDMSLPRGRRCLGAVDLPDASFTTFTAALRMIAELIPQGVSGLEVDMEACGGCRCRLRLVENPYTDGTKFYTIEMC